MAKKINPDFQAAPFLGPSSFDPIESTKRLGKTMYSIENKKQEEREEATLEGLQRLSVEVKGWADQKGLEEVLGEEQALQDQFISLMRGGIDVANPKNAKDQMAYKTINEALGRVKSKAMIYNTNKVVFDDIIRRLNDPRMDELMDKEATRANLESTLQGGDIFSMGKLLNSAIVMKPQREDIVKQINSIRPQLPQPQITERVVLDEAGNQNIVKDAILSPQAKKETVKKLRLYYSGLTPQQKASVKMNMNDAKEMDRLYPMEEGEERIPAGWNEEDFYIYMAMPEYKETFSNKPRSGSGLGITINAFGRDKFETSVGVQREEPLDYGPTYRPSNVYKFDTKEKLTFNVGEKGSTQYINGEWEELSGGDVEATLQYYDPKEDVFIFRTAERNNYPMTLNNSTIKVPRSIFGKEADGLKVKTLDGKTTTLGELQGPVKTVKKAIKGKSYEKTVPLK